MAAGSPTSASRRRGSKAAKRQERRTPWDTLLAALGIGDGAAVGDAVHADLGGADTLDGVIDYVTPEFVGVRTEDSLYRPLAATTSAASSG